MTTATITRQYSNAAKRLPPDALLGNICWFTITDADVHLASARKEIQALGLSTHGLRKNLRPVDAFKRASVEIAKRLPAHNQRQSHFLVRNAGQDGDHSYRHVVLERLDVQDRKPRRLTYDSVARLVYHRGQKKNGEYEGYSVELHRVDPPGLRFTSEEDAWLTQALRRFPDRFRHLCEHMDSHAVRTYVREYIYFLNGILAREGGGVYFVPSQHSNDLEKLSTWVHGIGSHFHLHPLLDLENSREMLIKAFESDTIGEIEAMSAEIDKILSNPTRTVTELTFNRYATAAGELVAKTEEYSELLGSRLESARIRLDFFKKQTVKLIERASLKDG